MISNAFLEINGAGLHTLSDEERDGSEAGAVIRAEECTEVVVLPDDSDNLFWHWAKVSFDPEDGEAALHFELALADGVIRQFIFLDRSVIQGVVRPEATNS